MPVLLGDDISMFHLFLYLISAFVITLLMILLLYVACSRKYRLNWFEKNLLERQEQKEGILESTSSSIQSFYPSAEDVSGSLTKLTPNAPLIGTSNVPVSVAEEVLPGTPNATKVPPYLHYPRPAMSDSSSSPQSDFDKNMLMFNSPTKGRQITMQSKLDPNKINTSLYQETTNTQPANENDEISVGIVHLILSYDIQAGILNVRIIEANDLRATEYNGTANPYAKVRLLPHHANVWQTRVHKRTLNPVFDEDFVFELNPQEICRHTLEILLCDFIAYSRHRNIGSIKIPLSHIDLSQQMTIWKELTPCSERDTKAELGDILVSFAYLPSAERLTVTIIKARNLRIVDESRTSSDPFIKVAIIIDGKRVKKQKTSFHRNTIAPVFNEALSFDITRDNLKRCCIEFRVFHDSLLGSSELLGYCIVGNDPSCRLQERQLYSQLLHDQVVSAQWIPLTDSYSHQ